MRRGALLYILFLGYWGSLVAQSSGLRSQRIVVQPPAQSIDSLVVVPNSLRVIDLRDGSELSPASYQFQFQKIYWLGTNLPDSVQVYYRCFPPAFRLSRQLLDTSILQQEEVAYQDILIDNPLLEEIFREERTLNYQGSFSRGLSFGNNQDLVLNSRFNLQMAGQLSNGMEIKAAITDENIPLQAAGNTQQLREFDRIFVQLTKDRTTLTAGDYELRRPTGYFMNYLKKLQGATLSNEQHLGEKGILRGRVSGAVARGKFARNLLAVQEGNQGPYQLQGSDGELFIIVLSGTEKVWVDGQLMQRGLEYDYIIDYNLGELTFTQQRLITKDSRVVVEFDYSVQNYLRSLYAINTEYEQGRFRAYFNVYSEQDSRNSTGGRPLTEVERAALQLAGDDPLQAVVSSRDTFDSFDPSRVYYRLVDTILACGQTDSILVYSPSASTAEFIATFALVGPGNGDYELDTEQVVNQRVFRYVAPDPVTCAPRGSYAAIRQLVPPQQLQLYTLGGDYQLGKTGRVRAELGLSRRDINRFSNIDDDDNDGYALRLDWAQPIRVSKDSNFIVEPFINYEGVQDRFRTLNPYRNPDFLRDWNLTDVNGIGTVDPATEQLLGGGFRLRQKKHDLRYAYQSFDRDSLYAGRRHDVQANGQWKYLHYTLGGSLLDSEGTSQRTRFWRPNLLLQQTLPFLNEWVVSLKGQREKSDRYAMESDTLLSSSFFFDRYGLALESPTQESWKLRLAYEERVDYQTQVVDYRRSSTAREWLLNGQRQWTLPNRGRLQLNGNLTYRRLELAEESRSTAIPGATLLGRQDVNLTLWKGALRSVTTYLLGSGQEPQREFTFLRVNQGEGTHIWLDSLNNNDGVIQLNEMELAPFPDLADYVRVSTFSNTFLRTDNVGLNQSLALTPRAVWSQAKGWRKRLTRWSTQSTIRIDRKTRRSPGVSAWNPFQLNVADTSLVAAEARLANTLFYQRSHPVFETQLRQELATNKIVQNTGAEARRLDSWTLRLRWNVNDAFNFILENSLGNRINESEAFENRSYQLRFRAIQPELNWQPSRDFRLRLRYQYRFDQDQLVEDGDEATQSDLALEANYNRSAKSSLQVRFSRVGVAYTGLPNSPVGFAILNGLQPGENYLWTIGINRQLAKNIRLRVSYDGRKTGMARVVHVGRVQVGAVF